MYGGVQEDFETFVVPADDPLLLVPADETLFAPAEETVIQMLDDDNVIVIYA